ncbi:hypothetical protein O181_065881 [Austropuccinia psidii MF-1]|uniref:Integrase zinc-binding domain-containing protein n=1 Tax=Austropuccinia psidii MF-1 TaxID=1389203 RepID=A0A9Q3I1M6_9BASI|nr:hypothetical protein [Austropuccinia psidii MF-1]
MNYILTVFNGSTIFSKIDLCGAYNILIIKEGDEHVTPFWTKYGSYEYLDEFLSEFHITITYHPGRQATLPDALSHQENMYPERGVDFIDNNPQKFHLICKKDGIQESIFFSIKVEMFSDLVGQIQKEVWQDNDYKEVLKKLERGESVPDYSLETKSKFFLFKDRVVIPRNQELRLDIPQKCHDSQLAGHPGQEKTFKLIERNFHWAGMNHIIKDCVLMSEMLKKQEHSS